MANLVELRDLDQARRFLLQGLWLQRVSRPRAGTMDSALSWALEIISSGQPVPGMGVIVDVGLCAFPGAAQRKRESFPEIPGLPKGLLRTYEDYVLGKIYGDFTFERASAALQQYKGRDQARGLAYVIQQFRSRADFLGVLFSPAVLKTLSREHPERILAEGWESLLRDGVMPLVIEAYESLIGAARRIAELLGPEDLFELEHGTALDELGQRVALRQVLSAGEILGRSLPVYRLPPLVRRHSIPTHIWEEDTYPVGGFSSLSTKGSIESLLQSQLVFMEKGGRPDLFDIKYVREELLYYARDENQFFRQRRTYILALFPDLIHARFKNPELPYQRIVLLLALITLVVRKLVDWLREEALHFEIHFVQGKNQSFPLEAERNLLQTLLREQIANGTVLLHTAHTSGEVVARCVQAARRSLCHCLVVGQTANRLPAEEVIVSQLKVSQATPQLILEEGRPVEHTSEDALSQWQECVETLLRFWL